jgi:hypothetical protein
MPTASTTSPAITAALHARSTTDRTWRGSHAEVRAVDSRHRFGGSAHFHVARRLPTEEVAE